MDLPVSIQLYNAPIDGVGVPLCAALTIIRKSLSWRARP
jgi:hypothetical protein